MPKIARLTTHAVDEKQIKQAVDYLKQGKVIAYPTEAVFGFGCDPFNQQAVEDLLKLKQRTMDKGLLLVAFNWEQIQDLIKGDCDNTMMAVRKTWPGHITWAFPATDKVPSWIKGAHDTIAIRLSAHPVVQALCKEYGGPIVSTSANIEGEKPIRNLQQLKKDFDKKVAMIVSGDLGKAKTPSKIQNAITGEIIRA